MPWLTPLLRCLSFCFSGCSGCGESANEDRDGTKQTTNCQKTDTECETEDPATHRTLVRLWLTGSVVADVRFQKMKPILTTLTVILLLIAQGCVTGPVRYKTVGRYEYATVEWTRRASAATKPFAFIGGAATDIIIAGADTVFTPLASIPIAARAAFWGPCAASRNFRDHPISETTLTVVFYPFWFIAGYTGSLYFQTYEPSGTPYFDAFYPNTWGDESGVFKDRPILKGHAEHGGAPNPHSPSDPVVGDR